MLRFVTTKSLNEDTYMYAVVCTLVDFWNAAYISYIAQTLLNLRLFVILLPVSQAAFQKMLIFLYRALFETRFG